MKRTAKLCTSRNRTYDTLVFTFTIFQSTMVKQKNSKNRHKKNKYKCLPLAYECLESIVAKIFVIRILTPLSILVCMYVCMFYSLLVVFFCSSTTFLCEIYFFSISKINLVIKHYHRKS